MRKKTAFSLLELAIVIVVIGVLTLGIMKGAALVNGSRLASARSLTVHSKISEINGLLAWYETTLKESLAAGENIENAQMTTWNNIASQRAIQESLNVLSRSADSNVVYRADGINGLPSLQFAAAGRFSLSALQQGKSTDYSVFAVLLPTLDLSGVTMTFIDSHSSGSSNAVSILASSASIASGTSASITTSFAQSQKYVLGVYINSSATSAFVNSTTAATGSGVTVNGFDGFTVGANKSGSNGFTGLLSEILVFDRILSEKERQMVMSYLSKKYKIRVSGAY